MLTTPEFAPLPRTNPPGSSPRTASIRAWLCCCLLFLALALASCQPRLRPQSSLTPATVQQIVSGNTLEVIVPGLANNQIQRVRLIGLDSPNPAQRPWGKAAMDFLRDLDKQTVQLEFDLERQDPYDRLLAYVWYGDQLINLAMVAQGYALMDSPLPNIRYETQLRRAQESARLQGLGIWDPANPMRQTPDEFREQRPT
jgi:micrococcal nuclease